MTPPRSRGYLGSLLFDRSRRLSVLIVIAYLSGIGGLSISLLGTPAQGDYRVVGIALMAVSFLSLFLVSVSILELTEGGDVEP